MTHSRYGSDGRSLNVGRRPDPTTESISCCAFSSTSGCRSMAKRKCDTVVIVWRMSVQTWRRRKQVGTYGIYAS